MIKTLSQLKPYRPALAVFGGALVLLMLYFLVRGKKAIPGENKPANGTTLSPVTAPKMTLRNDEKGLGHYGASRDSGLRSHAGIDVLVQPGQLVLAPFAGTVSRAITAYWWSNKWKGVEIISTDKTLKAKILYCITTAVGKTVEAGQAIATAQAISQQYGQPMKDHLHIELYHNNQRTDPSNWFVLG
jgi:murein DD-endopeptidase MepM/ murein hydrolase activator NlpD